jgi:beta-hydroxylase
VDAWYSGAWNVIPLKTPHDHKIGAAEQKALLERNRAACPVADEVTRFIPGNSLVGFSILSPGCEIDTHEHEDGQFICHVGLSIPPGCGLRVRDETRTWVEGEALVFDEAAPHSAYNRGDAPRAAFLFDFSRGLPLA